MSDNLSPSYTQNAMYPSPLSPSPALSASSTPQQQHEQHQQQHPPSSHQQPLAPTYSNPTSGAGQQQPAHQANPLDPYGQKYTYGASQQPPSTNYNSYQSGPSSVQPSSSSAPPARVPAVPVAYPLDTQQPLPQFSRSYPSYSLPAMHGPIMSNIHNPNNQMALIGSMQPNLLPGFHSGHAASLHHVYSGHPHPHPHHLHGLVPPPQNDRPFRCDLCPQSFNRNHDLKRHKRIHLAVKPFPCHHCDKSFSRKDALKRHILVKGCGKDPAPENSNSPNTVSSTSTSAIMKNEGMRGTVSPPLASTLRLDK
ncbi:transcriptional regulator of sulfur amino acid metabolism [Emydomyces testavorans]|uniref:Transcriptional regulator of sulfur amino acid metabolism n=1 Tax=Emydomyces testavorans TaxID=2070801 RepID=A0AAF0IL68_9EURO|nr:transcriptional regulator of sulfur amino acid metabolism [Emydomyces testavorans]